MYIPANVALNGEEAVREYISHKKSIEGLESLKSMVARSAFEKCRDIYKSVDQYPFHHSNQFNVSFNISERPEKVYGILCEIEHTVKRATREIIELIDLNYKIKDINEKMKQ